MEVCQKSKNRTVTWPSNSTPGYISKNPKTLILKDTCTPMLIAALFIIAKILKQPKCPSTAEWIRKMWYIYTQCNTIQPEKWNEMNEILPLAATCVGLEGIMLSEMSDRERHILYDITYIWNLKNTTHYLI